MIHLRKILKKTLLTHFNLKLAPEQERFLFHIRFRSLAQAYVYREQCQPFWNI